MVMHYLSNNTRYAIECSALSALFCMSVAVYVMPCVVQCCAVLCNAVLSLPLPLGCTEGPIHWFI